MKNTSAGIQFIGIKKMRYKFCRIFREQPLDEKRMLEAGTSIPMPGKPALPDQWGSMEEVIECLDHTDENRAYIVFEEIDGKIYLGMEAF